MTNSNCGMQNRTRKELAIRTNMFQLANPARSLAKLYHLIAHSVPDKVSYLRWIPTEKLRTLGSNIREHETVLKLSSPSIRNRRKKCYGNQKVGFEYLKSNYMGSKLMNEIETHFVKLDNSEFEDEFDRWHIKLKYNRNKIWIIGFLVVKCLVLSIGLAFEVSTVFFFVDWNGLQMFGGEQRYWDESYHFSN